MGLVAAALGSTGGVLADQWKEYFYCEALPVDVLVAKGQHRASGRSTNTKGGDNIITTGSMIVVADGQCMIIVDQGRVVEVCSEPGEYTYDASTEPSVFAGNLGESALAVLKNMVTRFTYGGEAPKDQRIYYFNIKEIIGNKYGTAAPVPFRVVDQNIGLDIDISVRCFGEYSYRISNPILFYTNVCGNVTSTYTRDQIDSQLKTELLTALQPAFARISEMGVRYSALPAHTDKLATFLNEELSGRWRDLRGIEIVAFGISSVKAPEEDEKMIKELQRNATLRDPNMRMAHMAGASAAAMQTAAGNEAGAMNGFVGMGMANMFGGQQAAAFSQPAPAAAPMQNQYGMAADGGFGAAKPAAAPAPAPAPAAGAWKCSCGNMATGKFCPECGSPKPAEAAGWTCSCGNVNKGRFCSECGSPKPAGVPQYKCDKCGWEPADPTKPPRFCPECGDPFGDEDIK